MKSTTLSTIMLATASLAMSGCFDSNYGNDINPTQVGYWPAEINCFTIAEEPADLDDADPAATPRSDRTAELLALQATGELIAPEDVYQRVVAELTGIRDRFPNATDHEAIGCWDPSRLLIRFEAETQAEVNDEQYQDWDDLNDIFSLGEVEYREEININVLKFDGRFNPGRLAREYSSLDGAIYTAPATGLEDGNDICLSIREDKHFYIFKQGWGSCLGGCENRSFLGVQVDSSGNIEQVGQWAGGGQAPGWFRNARDCRAFLPWD